MSEQHLVGSIVTARGREWVVQPGSAGPRLKVQPLGGDPRETTVILSSLEEVKPARFAPPNPESMGDHASAWLMRAAARIGNTNASGPFRCLGRIGVQPRPYQYVPLLMALRQEPVRLLIADDVGVGKTVEALLIARELMDRGEIEGFCILCPPHLAEQWQQELKDKFHIEAELYLPRTADRIHRALSPGESPFKRHPVMVASLEFVKREDRRDSFLLHAPPLVIVDEAHTCTSASDSKHLRYELVERLGRDRKRHLVLVTATPHTGKEDAFARLMGLLEPELNQVASNLHAEANRRRLATHLVQRRRGDIADYLEGTTFPKLLVRETSYQMHPDARSLLIEMVDKVRAQYDGAKGDREKRVQWWSLLSMVRAFASSPMALSATLQNRSITADADSPDEADRMGQESLLVDENDTTFGAGVVAEYKDWTSRAEALAGAKDHKLKAAAALVEELLASSRGVLVFCQFVETAEYVAEFLRTKLKVAVDFVTGKMDNDDRRARIDGLQKPGTDKRVLVATDCLSEGVNLQDGFDAVFHYDLAWNPTRHEQREGRVDRYGQRSPEVRSVVYYGTDNLIDGIVLDVLIRKQRQIRKDIQIQVPAPRNHADVERAIMEGLLLRKRVGPVGQTSLASFGSDVVAFHTDWERRGEREKRSRTMFAQVSIKEQDVAEAIESAQKELASSEVAEFVRRCLSHSTIKASVTPVGDAWKIGVSSVDPEIQHALGLFEETTVRFDPDPTRAGEYLHRSHPLVQALCQYAIETAMDDLVPSPAARCSAIVTKAVAHPTALFVVRFRYRMRIKGTDRLIEDVAVYGMDSSHTLQPEVAVKPMIAAAPAGNLAPEARLAAVRSALNDLERLMPALQAEGETRCREAKRLHEKVRDAANLGLGRVDIEVNGLPDVLGVYAFLPKEGAA